MNLKAFWCQKRVLDPNGATASFRVGEVVQVRSEAEILATLDERGEFESLPFMPEMLQYCDQFFTVYKLASKVCFPTPGNGTRRLDGAVLLEGLRCDGTAHGGCQASCFLLWKEVWLRRVGTNGSVSNRVRPSRRVCTPALLAAATRKPSTKPEPSAEVYSCQATELPRAAPDPVPFWDLRQYVADIRSKNVPPGRLIRSVAVGLFNKYQDLSRQAFPSWLRIRGGRRYPLIQGRLTKTPNERLDLRPGDRVEIKSRGEIVGTLNCDNRTRGLAFAPEMLEYCGQPARVLRRVDRLIDEHTGEMIRLQNPCIILDGVVCKGDYSRNCAKTSYAYWRESWLRRV